MRLSERHTFQLTAQFHVQYDLSPKLEAPDLLTHRVPIHFVRTSVTRLHANRVDSFFHTRLLTPMNLILDHLSAHP